MKHLLAIALTCAASGCLAPAMYRTAHVLPKGETDFGMAFTIARVATGDYTTDRGTVLLPATGNTYVALLPEVSLHHGLGVGAEVGGRIAGGATIGELDLKYRLVGDDVSRLHVALQPAAGYRARAENPFNAVPDPDIGGYHVTLPVIVTYDVSPTLALSGAAFGLFTSYRDFDDREPDLVGRIIYSGGSLSLRVQAGRTFYLIPSVELQRSIWRQDRASSEPTITMFAAGLGFGWGAPR